MKVTKEFIIETTAKALISFIPFAGGAVGSVLADVMAERKQQRLNDFLTQLKDDLEKNEEKVNKDLVAKDDFLDIFELTAKKVMEERNEVKRLAYKNILVNGLIQTDTNFDDIEQCIRLVENTTENNIYLLKVLSDPEGHNTSLGEPVKQPNGNMSTTTLSRVLQKLLPGWQGGKILENLKDLEFIGMILPISNSFQDMVTANGLSPVVNSLTLKGERFVKYLKI
jgi:hypothetical protein